MHKSWDIMCHQISNIRCAKYHNLNISHLFLVLQVSLSNLWSHVLSRESRCSWSSANRRCSNYIWVINNAIEYKGLSYVKYLTAILHQWSLVMTYSGFIDWCMWYVMSPTMHNRLSHWCTNGWNQLVHYLIMAVLIAQMVGNVNGKNHGTVIISQ